MRISDSSALNGAGCRIFGLGRSNEALISFLNRNGADVTVSDKRMSENEIASKLSALGCKNVKIIPYNETVRTDFVFRTPGIHPDSPEIVSAIGSGAILSSEAELFFNIAKGKILGVTGSDGKTTTTTLAHLMLSNAIGKESVFIGGNIGVPLISFVDKLSDDSITVCELSSFQLMTMDRAPGRAVITNITENHLDYHKSFREYVLAKLNIFSEGCITPIISKKIYDFIYKSGFNVPINPLLTDVIKSDCKVYLSNSVIYVDDVPFLNLEEVAAKEKYNAENYMNAIALALPWIDSGTVMKVAKEFKGVEHRNELVREVGGIRYFNCSVDSTPSRTVETLKNHTSRKVVLICGGYDKNLDYSPLGRYISDNGIVTVVMGQTANKIISSLNENDRFFRATDLNDAISIAIGLSREGYDVVFSPASASFDMFKDFDERGKLFKNIINNI